MKVYLAVPLLHNRNKVLTKDIFKIIKNMGCEIVSDWILLDDPNPNLDAKGIYERDSKAISSCDVLIAEVSEPSIGVGMEIMLAYSYGKKIICIHKNTKISNILKGMPRVCILSYANTSDLSEKLRDAIFC